MSHGNLSGIRVHSSVLTSEEYFRILRGLPRDIREYLEYEAPTPLDPRPIVTLVRQAGPYALQMLRAVAAVDTYEVYDPTHPQALSPDQLQGVFDEVKSKLARSR